MLNVDSQNVGNNDFTDSVKIYFKDLQRCKPLTREKEKELMALAKEGDVEARNKILSSNLRFVFNIAKKYRGKGVSIADLISEGNKGLLKAFNLFDQSKDVKFFSYAVWWIRQKMIKAIENKNIMKESEVSFEEIFPVYNETPQDASDELLPVEDDGYKVSMMDVKDDILNNLERDEEEKQKKVVVKELLAKLPKRERIVVEKYYGLEKDDDGQSLEEISVELNISTERVRQIKMRALNEMRMQVFDIEEAEFLFS
jgi:RNA polymerase primary sigma factor